MQQKISRKSQKCYILQRGQNFRHSVDINISRLPNKESTYQLTWLLANKTIIWAAKYIHLQELSKETVLRD
jgi:hypothetical protein